MKFLCIECDQPMSLFETGAPEDGSLAIKFECPTCLHQIAMLTNPYETQVVSSLGVKIGKGEPDPAGVQPEEGPECPLPAMVAEATAAAAATPAGGTLAWSAEALARLERIPEFVRPMAVSGIERYAREQGRSEVDEATLDEARDFFGM